MADSRGANPFEAGSRSWASQAAQPQRAPAPRRGTQPPYWPALDCGTRSGIAAAWSAQRLSKGLLSSAVGENELPGMPAAEPDPDASRDEVFEAFRSAD